MVAEKKKSGWLNLVVDYGPLLIFFLVYRHYSPADKENAVGEVFAVMRGTGAFIVAAIAALGISKWRLGKVSPMLWLSTALIVGFGGLTILLHDPFYVQIKPTAIYILFAAVLLVGYWKGKALLKILLESAFEGLDDEGWMLLSRNWGFFFLFLAALNEGLRLWLSFGDWLATKLWVFMPLSFLFTFSQIPMLLRHGLGEKGQEEAESQIPPS
ncbi:inner membrane-spanning protein YciB [Tsuneonella sp. CC-YZS046]|uniref:inner membrane-spanning protein YciB n=1 Tax=Tsuneonella sp. CC-YZS046 TaxID=3042152 RepID=UPI002D78A992|nr:inner membrane-spanning protein YciB [Tsuneonella sp. CC-YZS046]WRO67467.1 inner membrane-spanning protein YciB [Tsuneonella sp. CC-YZS046]